MPSSSNQKPKSLKQQKSEKKKQQDKQKQGKKDQKKKGEQERGNKDKDREKKLNKKDPPQDDNERWGNLPPHIREFIHADRKKKIEGKYSEEILRYYEETAGAGTKKEKEKDK